MNALFVVGQIIVGQIGNLPYVEQIGNLLYKSLGKLTICPTYN